MLSLIFCRLLSLCSSFSLSHSSRQQNSRIKVLLLLLHLSNTDSLAFSTFSALSLLHLTLLCYQLANMIVDRHMMKQQHHLHGQSIHSNSTVLKTNRLQVKEKRVGKFYLLHYLQHLLLLHYKWWHWLTALIGKYETLLVKVEEGSTKKLLIPI